MLWVYRHRNGVEEQLDPLRLPVCKLLVGASPEDLLLYTPLLIVILPPARHPEPGRGWERDDRWREGLVVAVHIAGGLGLSVMVFGVTVFSASRSILVLRFVSSLVDMAGNMHGPRGNREQDHKGHSAGKGSNRCLGEVEAQDMHAGEVLHRLCPYGGLTCSTECDV